MNRYFVSADGTNMPKWYKDPDDVQDYTLDFRHKLVTDDYIVSVTFRANSELTILSYNIADSIDFDDEGNVVVDAQGDPIVARADSAASVWISTGLLGRIYDVVCHVVTLEGRQMDRTFQLVIGTN